MSSPLESALRLSVRWHFGHLNYPELNIVLREVDDLLMDRVAHPEIAYRDQREFDQRCERELAWEACRFVAPGAESRRMNAIVTT